MEMGRSKDVGKDVGRPRIRIASRASEVGRSRRMLAGDEVQEPRRVNKVAVCVRRLKEALH